MPNIQTEAQLVQEEHQKVLDHNGFTEDEYKKDVSKTSRSWFAVFCNPHLYGFPFECMTNHYLYNLSTDDDKYPKIERTFKYDNGNKTKRLETDEERYQRLFPELLRQQNPGVFKEEVKKMLDKMQSMWIVSVDGSGKEVYSTSRAGAWVYCISAKGLHHVHMVLEDGSPVRWASIRNIYPHMNIKPTRGTKKEVEDYINKVGKFEEKGEIIVDKVSYGEIYGKGSGHRTDLDEIQALLDAGKQPRDIITSNIRYARYSKLITQYYLDKKYDDFLCSDNNKNKDDPVREVDVHWLFGSTGVGKTNSYRELCKKHGVKNVFRVTNYKNPFDGYLGEDIIFFDEFRGELNREGFKLYFSNFLLYIDNVICDLPCRFYDKKSLYKHIYICSPYLPQECYPDYDNDDPDGIEQLMRRITDITYLYKDKRGSYRNITIKVRDNKVIHRDTFFIYAIDSVTNRRFKKRNNFVPFPFLSNTYYQPYTNTNFTNFSSFVPYYPYNPYNFINTNNDNITNNDSICNFEEIQVDLEI